MKRIIIIVSILVILVGVMLIIFSTTGKQQLADISEETDSILIGLGTSIGGFADKSFNDLQYTGLINANLKYGVEFIVRSPHTYDDSEDILRELIMEGADVIFAGSGWSMVEPVDVLAREYPDIKFVIFDDFAKEYLPNVASVTFKQNEGSFLAGAFAALQTTTGRIGVIGGLDIPVINDFIVGYEAGARFINPNIRIYTDFISRHNATSNPFSDPDTAHKIAMEMYGRRDVDIIFGVAGASGFGIFNAASQMGQYAIGVDSDQDYLAEGTILTSMMKRMDKSIEMLAGIILAGRFENKPYMLGLVEECIGLSEMEFTRDKIPTTTLDAINNIKSQIVSGEIVVPTKLIHN